MTVPAAVARALLDAWAVALPTECSGCGAPDQALCAACRSALAAEAHPCLRGDAVVWAALDYSGVARRVIGAYKDGGRTDAAGALAAPLRAAVAAALTAAPPGDDGAGVHLVSVPSSRRAWRIRGYHPVDLLLGRAGLARRLCSGRRSRPPTRSASAGSSGAGTSAARWPRADPSTGSAASSSTTS